MYANDIVLSDPAIERLGHCISLGLEMLNCHTKGLEMSRFDRFLRVNF